MKKNNSIPVGTSDYYGKEALLRDYVLKKLENIYRKYGFEPLYTPILENEVVFKGHHGEGEKLLFKLSDKDNNNYVLKYDSTVPLARVVGMYSENIAFPYKRFQFQQSFRDDEVDKGHYREFIQCDGDIVGSNSLVSDSELVMISYDGLSSLGFENFTIRLNHRKIIKAIAEKANLNTEKDILEIQRAIDYADKIIKNGVDGIKEDLDKRNINNNVTKIIVDLVEISNNSKAISDILNEIETYFNNYPTGISGIRELKEIISYLPKSILEKVKIDFTLARGADYYTGFILEAVINNIKLGAVLGGGRYDNLVSSFGEKSIPAVGMAFGMERLLVAMKELGLNKEIKNCKNILIYADETNKINAISLANKLRQNYNVNLIFSSDISSKNIKDYCEKGNISILCLLEDNNFNITKIDSDCEYYDKVSSDLMQLKLKRINKQTSHIEK